jgi:hypothetical protein
LEERAMRRDPWSRCPPSLERGAGNRGSADQNLPRFSSTATTVPEGCTRDDRDLADESEPAGLAVDFLVDLLVDLAADPPDDLPAELPDDLLADLRPVGLRPVLT